MSNNQQGGVILAVFKMIKYHKQQYPSNIPLNTEEIAGHFDVKSISTTMDYSLHTEYSYGKRNFINRSLDGLNSIISANKNGVPQLWKCESWAEEFAEFIIRETKDFIEPKVIEIHPPFDDYINDIKVFVSRYKIFEDVIENKYSNTEIHIENRCGSVYSGGKFLISKMSQVIELCENIERENLKLKIAFDIPQLYTAHNVSPSKKYLVSELLNEAKQCREYIAGVHLWGKGLSTNGRKVAHYGDFNTYFNNDMELKYDFLSTLGDLFDDNIYRNLVLEVNSSNNDILSIINDLNMVGFKYV